MPSKIILNNVYSLLSEGLFTLFQNGVTSLTYNVMQ